jgi:polyribonucleotide nucleotidyltransferase
VVTIKEFGAFVEFLPGKDGLVHISELANFRVAHVEDIVKMGDEIWVKCLGVDEKGRVRLSRRAAMADRDAAAGGAPAEGAPAGEGGAPHEGGEQGHPREGGEQPQPYGDRGGEHRGEPRGDRGGERRGGGGGGDRGPRRDGGGGGGGGRGRR